MSGGRREAEALRAIEAQIEAMTEGAPACFVLDDASRWGRRGIVG